MVVRPAPSAELWTLDGTCMSILRSEAKGVCLEMSFPETAGSVRGQGSEDAVEQPEAFPALPALSRQELLATGAACAHPLLSFRD